MVVILRARPYDEGYCASQNQGKLAENEKRARDCPQVVHYCCGG
jgi:hypothetical protein